MKKKRTIISYRNIGDEVNPMNMTRKEYINYLCHKFGFRISAGWDGIEKRHYRANWSEDELYNIKTRDEALEFLGITKTPEAPDGVENRYLERRVNTKKYKGVNKRKYVRRKDEIRARKQDAILYYSAMSIGFGIVIVTYGLIIQELMK